MGNKKKKILIRIVAIVLVAAMVVGVMVGITFSCVA